MPTLHLTPAQAHTIRHALIIAAERFDEHVKTFVAVAEENAAFGQDGLVTTNGAHRLAEQFRIQAKETRDLIEIFDE